MRFLTGRCKSRKVLIWLVCAILFGYFFMQYSRNIITKTDQPRVAKIRENERMSFVETTWSIAKDSGDYKLTMGSSDLTKVLNRKRLLSPNLSNMSCQSLFDNDQQAIEIAMNMTSRQPMLFKTYIRMFRHCKAFIAKRGFLNFTFTEIEKNFPIAFSIVMYKDVEQTERLLRAIYRPQNFYCIHVDAKAHDTVKLQMKALSSCFPNVILPENPVNVQWGKFTVLESELVCMRELWRYKGWKYFINLTGQEFPLKTNLELVKILTALKGASLADGSRQRTKYFLKRFRDAGSPPHGINLVKGLIHVALNRDFVDFILHDNRSLDFLEWLKKTKVPDETFFPSLNHNPQLGIPGSFLGDGDEYPQKPSIIRFKNKAVTIGSTWNRPCSGKYVRLICILGVGDLHRLPDNVALFVNKIHIDYQPLTYECLEQLMYNKTRQQYLNQEIIDVGFYERLDQVKYRLIKT